MSAFDDMMNTVDQQLLATFGDVCQLTLADTTLIANIMAAVDNDLHVADEGGGFTNRYSNRSDNHIANRFLVDFLLSDVVGLNLWNAVLTLPDGTQYEIHEPVDEDKGMITYGAAKR